MENINKTECLAYYKYRKNDGHKGSFGKTLIMASSEDYPGAGLIAAMGALRSGVGIVTLALPDCLKGMIPFVVPPEVILRFFPSKDGCFYLSLPQAIAVTAGYDSVLVGSGWGKSPSRLECLINVSKAVDSILILDADALNLIAENQAFKILDDCRGKTAITPHIAEFTRLLGQKYLDLELQNRLKLAKAFADSHHTVVVQKSSSTIVTDSKADLLCEQPNSGLAKGGSGDLLAGLIAGIAASKQSKDLCHAAALGVYLHSQAGLLAKKAYTECGMTVSDVADFLTMAWRDFLSKN